MLDVWPNANIVVIENCQDIYNHRKFNPNRFGLRDYWDEIRDNSWPSDAPETWTELQQLPHEIQIELKELFGFEILRYVLHPEAQQAFDQDRIKQINSILKQYPNNCKIELAGSVYMSWDQTAQAIEHCYNTLGLEDFDIEFVNQYYTRWLRTISTAPISIQ